MTDKQLIALIAELWGITGIVLFATGHWYTAAFCVVVAIVQGLKSNFTDEV
jgi:hypothetical protein